MSGGISAATLVTAAQVAGAVATAYGAYESSRAARAPKIEAPKPPPTPQAGKNADRSAALNANAVAALPGGSLTGNSGTFLTGPTGISPGSLNLGRNTLLGQ